MSRVIAAAFATALVAIVAPTAASAGCYSATSRSRAVSNMCSR